MAINTNNIKDFERLHESIKNARASWESGNIKPSKADTYAGLWKELNSMRVFLENERKDKYAEFERLGELYNADVLGRERIVFNGEFEKLAAVVEFTFREKIKEFTEAKHKQVTKMVRTAPTESMRNLLETLKLRDDLDAVELHDIMPVFFENYHAVRALQAISRQNGITLTVPVQMDCTAMHQTIDKAHEYLLGACGELLKPKSKTTHYNDFFTVNHAEPDTVYSPVYKSYIEVLDYVPQLQDCTADKKALTALEKARVDWYYRDLPENANKTQLAQFTKEIMEKHPDDIPLLKLSQYADAVAVVEEASRPKE